MLTRATKPASGAGCKATIECLRFLKRYDYRRAGKTRVRKFSSLELVEIASKVLVAIDAPARMTPDKIYMFFVKGFCSRNRYPCQNPMELNIAEPGRKSPRKRIPTQK